VKLVLNVMVLSLLSFANLSLAQDQTFSGPCASDSRLQKAAEKVKKSIVVIGVPGTSGIFGISYNNHFQNGREVKRLFFPDSSTGTPIAEEGITVDAKDGFQIKTIANQCSVAIVVTTESERIRLSRLLAAKKLSTVRVNERFLISIVAVLKK
jgi:hypothetical protein